jgi:hypothetical protein
MACRTTPIPLLKTRVFVIALLHSSREIIPASSQLPVKHDIIFTAQRSRASMPMRQRIVQHRSMSP